jgi:RimJ/RimL family protein N-acetyltransferase
MQEIARNEFGQPIGAPVVGWTARERPPRSAMHGRWCRVEPYDVARHGAELEAVYAEAGDARDWTYLAANRVPIPPDGGADPMHHTIVDLATGHAVGTAALMRIDPANGVIEVGWVTYSQRLQRTAMATEAMYLLMRRVFDELGYRRFEWKCDSLNARSRAAALRYGFQFEGIFRQAVVYKGRNRDTAWYSIINSEWPAIRGAYERWLAPDNFDSNGRQLRPLVARGDGAPTIGAPVDNADRSGTGGRALDRVGGDA